MDNEMVAPEVKADLSRELAGMAAAFEAFKETNDERLAQVERKGADVVTSDKLARIEAALDANQRRMDDLVLKGQRPGLGSRVLAVSEHKSAFNAYVRGGNEDGMRALERKAVTSGISAGDGGFTVPPEVEAQVLQRLSVFSPIRSIATVQTISSGSYRKPVTTAAPVANWNADGQGQTRAETSHGAISELRIDAMELSAAPAASVALLEDSAVDIEAWLAAEVETIFAEQENRAFVNGTGTGQPRGFMQTPKVAEASWAWGSLGFIKTGFANAFASSNQTDILVDLVYTLKAGYRQNASFVMNRTTQSAIRKFRDASGQYVWLPPATLGAKPTLFNFPVVETEDMPSFNAIGNQYAVAFGDFKRGYCVVDRQGIRILRDPYSAKPYVMFYTTKRVGGGVQDFDAIKLLQFAV